MGDLSSDPMFESKFDETERKHSISGNILNDNHLELLADFSKEENGAYCDGDLFKITKNFGVYSLNFFDPYTGEIYHIRNLRNLNELEKVYEAITDKKLKYKKVLCPYNIGDQVKICVDIFDSYQEIWHKDGDILKIKDISSDGEGIIFGSNLGTHWTNAEKIN